MTDPPKPPFPSPGSDRHRSAALSSILFSGLWPPVIFVLFCSNSPTLLFQLYLRPLGNSTLLIPNHIWGLRIPQLFFSSTPLFFSTAPSLLPTSVSFRYTNNGPTARSFASSSASHFLSGRLCHRIPILSKSFFKTRRSVLHFRHLVYRCITDCSLSPHHQHSADSTAPIRSRKVPIAPCPVLS